MTLAKFILSLFVPSCALIPIQATADIHHINYDQVNKQAQQEYLQPIRPGSDGRNPYWNGFAHKFTYAPAFDFKPVKGAKAYQFVIEQVDGQGTDKLSYRTDKPTADLSPVWDKVPVAKVRVSVFAIDRKGRVMPDTVGQRTFWRDYPFHGRYQQAPRPYLEAAKKAMLYIHNLKAIHHWRDHAEPDMSYKYNTYACKMMSATIQNECLVAQYFPALKEDALLMARHVAQFLMTLSHPKGHVLAYFPPTYYQELITSGKAGNKGKTITVEAAKVGNAMLTLYDATHDKQYLEFALGIANTYVRLQRPDGSLPIKVDYTTGEPVNDRCAMLHTLTQYWRRLGQQYHQTQYSGALRKAEQWMQDVALRSFDMTGQFEDVSVLHIQPYQNLTNCTAAPYASYLYTKDHPTPQEIQDADDLMRLSEDQFVHWDIAPDADGLRRENAPCVHEQYKYEVPVDNSACNVANGYLDKYHLTGDTLALAKAVALTNQIVVMQNPLNGKIPTTWKYSRKPEHEPTWWLNCCVASIKMLLRMDKER